MIKKLTAAEIADQRRGAIRIAPGIWLDRHGDPHISMIELLAMLDRPDTPENRDAVLALVKEALARHAPQMEIIEQEPEKEEE